MSGAADRTRPLEAVADLEAVDFRKAGGLVPVVAQEARSGTVLMVAWADREALARTLETGQMHYRSRSRDELWRKGETSGNTQQLVSMHLDCDGDTVLARVEAAGPACHTGKMSCFGFEAGSGSPPESTITPDPGQDHATTGLPFLSTLWRVLRSRADERPEGSYTVRLLDDENLRTKKLGEETAELIMALSRDDDEGTAEEAADLLYHLLAALLAQGVELERVDEILQKRHG